MTLGQNKLLLLQRRCSDASMASRQNDELDLNQPESAFAWLLAFNARARAKGWKDDGNANHITDNFLATCGIPALKKLQFIVAPSNPEVLKFSDIESALKQYLQPKKRLVIAERTRFHLLRQQPEESVANFILRLRQGIQYCDFDNLKSSSSPSEEMMLVGLVAGLNDPKIKEGVLDRIQSIGGNFSVAQVQDFVQQFEERRNFVNHKEANFENADIHFARGNRREKRGDHASMIKNCKYCGRDHPVRRCPAFGKVCSSCKKRNHLAAVCKSNSANHISDTSDDDLYFLDTNEINNIDDKKANVLINGKQMVMQIDTGASVTVISSKMWESLGRPHLQKSSRRMEVYDGRCLTTLGKFVATLERYNRYYPAELIVVRSEKDFGLLGRDLLRAEEATESVHHSSADGHLS